MGKTGVQLRVFSHSKGSEQVGAAKSARRKVGNRFPGRGFLFQENPSEQPNPHGTRLGTGFPGRCSQARFPGRGFQARFPMVPKRFPGTGSQAIVPSKRFPSKVPRNRFPSKVLRKRFPIKVPRQIYHEQTPKQGFPARGSQEEVTKHGSQEKVPRQGSQEVPRKVPRNLGTCSQEEVPKQGFPGSRFPGTGSQARVPRNRFCKHGFQEPFSRFRGTVSQAKQGSQNRFSSKCFQEQVSRKRCPSKVPSKFPKQDFQEHVFQSKTRFPEQVFTASVSRKMFPRKRCPSKVSSKLVPKQCFQEEVPEQGSQP